MPRSGKLPVLNLLTGQKSGFSPRRGDSLHRFTLNLAGPTGTWVRLVGGSKFHLNRPGGGENAAPKYEKFPLFGKESPRMGEPFNRFPNFLRGFIRTTILHLISVSSYGVIAEKPRVGHLGQIFPCTL